MNLKNDDEEEVEMEVPLLFSLSQSSRLRICAVIIAEMVELDTTSLVISYVCFVCFFVCLRLYLFVHFNIHVTIIITDTPLCILYCNINTI